MSTKNTTDTDSTSELNLPVEVTAENGQQDQTKNVQVIEGTLTEGTTAEMALVESTIAEIKNIYEKSSLELMFKVGEIVINMVEKSKPKAESKIDEAGIAQGSSDSVSVIKSATKYDIFRLLEKRFVQDSTKEGRLPKKTWLYSSVRLVEEQKVLAGEPGYSDLSVTHKIALLSAPQKKKAKLISEIVKENLTVKETKQIVQRENPTEKTIKHYINNPSEIKNIDKFITKFGEKLKKSEANKNDAVKLCASKIVEIEKGIEALSNDKVKIEELHEKFKSIEAKPTKGRRTPGKMKKK